MIIKRFSFNDAIMTLGNFTEQLYMTSIYTTL